MAKIEALARNTAIASVGGASASTGDTAAMHGIADVAKRREIPVISGDAFKVMLAQIQEVEIP